jgi:transcriptional regulator with XRE-family HTH domain
MATKPSPSSEVATYAEALRRLRERQGMSQEQAAKRLGQTKQSWQAYEAGERQAILRMDLQDRLMEALGLTRADLEEEHDQIARSPRPARSAGAAPLPPPSLQLPVWGRAKAGARAALVYDMTEPEERVDLGWIAGRNSGALRVAGDSMTGYVESGQLVIYDKSRWPRRGEGCVIETLTGELYVKEYVRSDDKTLHVTQRFPEASLEFALSDLQGVYAIRLRGD